MAPDPWKEFRGTGKGKENFDKIQTMKVAVGSQNPVKLECAKQAFQSL